LVAASTRLDCSSCAGTPRTPGRPRRWTATGQHPQAILSGTPSKASSLPGSPRGIAPRTVRVLAPTSSWTPRAAAAGAAVTAVTTVVTPQLSQPAACWPLAAAAHSLPSSPRGPVVSSPQAPPAFCWSAADVAKSCPGSPRANPTKDAVVAAVPRPLPAFCLPSAAVVQSLSASPQTVIITTDAQPPPPTLAAGQIHPGSQSPPEPAWFSAASAIPQPLPTACHGGPALGRSTVAARPPRPPALMAETVRGGGGGKVERASPKASKTGGTTPQPSPRGTPQPSPHGSFSGTPQPSPRGSSMPAARPGGEATVEAMATPRTTPRATPLTTPRQTPRSTIAAPPGAPPRRRRRRGRGGVFLDFRTFHPPGSEAERAASAARAEPEEEEKSAAAEPAPEPAPTQCGRRTRSWTPKGKKRSKSCGSSSSKAVGPARLLPSHWRRLVTAAYCEETGRPIIDRVRLEQCSTSDGSGAPTSRRAMESPDVFWLQTMVRWADLSLSECGRRMPCRGEDLTLFVLRCSSAAVSPDARFRSSSAARVRRWVVSSVRVLNSKPHGNSEDFTASGEVGGTLARWALGQSLWAECKAEEQ